MFIKLKQKIKKYQTKILSKKISGFGIFKFPIRKVLLGVFLLVMIFGGVFGNINNVKAYPPPTYSEGQCFGDNEAAKVACDKAAVANNLEASTVNPNIHLLKCSRVAPYCLKLSSSFDAATGTDFTEGALDVVGGAIGKVLEKIANIILAIVYGICWLLLHLAGLFVDLSAVFLHATLDSALYNDMFKSNMVSEGWTIVRDVCNMFFILILLVISLATILRIQTYKAQSLLLPLLIAAFLVNFSRPIVELAIDASQILMYQFVNMMGGSFIDSDVNQKLSGITDTFIGAFGGFDKVGAIVKGDLINAASWVIAIMFALVFLLVLAAVYIAMAMFMIIRLVALTILIIFSPIGFFFNILPQTKSYASKYWSELSKYLIFGPVMAFFIYLAGSLAITVPADLESRLTQIATEDGVLAVNKVLTEGGTVLVSLLGELLPYVVIMVFLYASIWIARQMGIWGADKVEGMTTGKLAAGGAAVGGFLGGAVGGYMSRSLAKGKLPWQDTVRSVATRGWGIRRIGKPIDKWVQGVAKKKMTTKSGKEISVGRIKEQALGLLSPEAIKRGYSAHVADEEAEAYGVSSGRMQDLIERTYVMGYKKPTHEELARQSQVADEMRKITTDNPKALANMLNSAIEDGLKEKAEAIMRKLASGGDTDSALEALKLENSIDGYDKLMKKFEPLLGKKQTAVLDSDVAHAEKGEGNYSYWMHGGYNNSDKEWKFNNEDNYVEEAAKKFGGTDPRKKMRNLDARTFMDEVKEIEIDKKTGEKKEVTKVKISRVGKEIVTKNLTAEDITWLKEAPTKQLRKIQKDKESIRKLGVWGNALMDRIDYTLAAPEEKGKGKGREKGESREENLTDIERTERV